MPDISIGKNSRYKSLFGFAHCRHSIPQLAKASGMAFDNPEFFTEQTTGLKWRANGNQYVTNLCNC